MDSRFGMEEEIPWWTQPMDKGNLLQATRAFSETPLNSRKCRDLLKRFLFLLHSAENLRKGNAASLTRTEATDLFFATTKLFQSRDILLHRTMYLILKDLIPLADDVIIIISSLTKDMTSNIPAYRANSIRTLAGIVDMSIMPQLDRFFRSAIVDKDASVAASALVAANHLYQTCPDAVRRWSGEAQEGLKNRNPMVQYHALGLIYAIKHADRLAIIKLITSSSASSIKSAYAQVLLVKFAKNIIIEDPNNDARNAIFMFLENALRHPADMVVLEAARALTEIPNVPGKILSNLISNLQIFLNSPRSTLRFAAVRTLNRLAARHSTLVSMCNNDLESAAADSNRSISTLAISTLLRTGSEASVERLVKLMSSFVSGSDVSDDFKTQLIDALKALCMKYENKSPVIMNLFAQMLRSEGGFDLKAAVVRAIISVVKAFASQKEKGLNCLCEFIEDCEYPTLATEIINVLSNEGPHMPNPTKYVRCIYNRTSLENSTVRAAAVAALAKFGLECPGIRPQITTLLSRCCYDGEDDVRDRAVFFLGAFEEYGEDEISLQQMILPEFAVPVENLIAALSSYLSSEETIAQGEFNFARVDRSGGSAEKAKLMEFGALISNKENAFAMEIKEPAEEVVEEKAPSIVKDLVMSENQKKHLLADLAKVEGLDVEALGKLKHATPAPIPLTEKETEYVVTCKKYVFEHHVLFEFKILNTLKEMELRNVSVEMIPKEEAGKKPFTVKQMIPAKVAKYDNPAFAYTLLDLPANTFAYKFAATLKFVMREVDEDEDPYMAEEIELDEDADEDEYPLDDCEITEGDFITPVVVESLETFDERWGMLGEDAQAIEMYNLSTVKDLKNAVSECCHLLCLAPVGDSDNVPESAKKHILYLAGEFCDGSPLLGRIRMKMDAVSGVVMELTVRSPNPALSQMIASAI